MNNDAIYPSHLLVPIELSLFDNFRRRLASTFVYSSFFYPSIYGGRWWKWNLSGKVWAKLWVNSEEFLTQAWKTNLLRTQSMWGLELETGCQLNLMHPCPQESHFVDPGETFSGQTRVMDHLLLDKKIVGDEPVTLLSGTEPHLIPQARDSRLVWLLSGLLGWIMSQFSKRVYLLKRVFYLISWLRVCRFCPVNHVAGVKLCQLLFIYFWGYVAFKGFGNWTYSQHGFISTTAGAWISFQPLDNNWSSIWSILKCLSDVRGDWKCRPLKEHTFFSWEIPTWLKEPSWWTMLPNAFQLQSTFILPPP